jgi:hypothetical protein
MSGEKVCASCGRRGTRGFRCPGKDEFVGLPGSVTSGWVTSGWWVCVADEACVKRMASGEVGPGIEVWARG